MNWPDQLARRLEVETEPLRKIWFVSPEDLILKKMDFYREGGSDKHIRDILGTLKISSHINTAYITDWAGKLAIRNLDTDLRSVQMSFPQKIKKGSGTVFDGYELLHI